jgi:hypothetical protein
MALFGSSRDINLFKHINKEVIENIMEQQVGYYKLIVEESPTNIYGESLNKSWYPPVLVYCVINHGEFQNTINSSMPDTARTLQIDFLKDHLKEKDIFPELGDVIVWNDDYYELKMSNENQYIAGKNPVYNYGDEYLSNYGESISVSTTFVYISPEKLNITSSRI